MSTNARLAEICVQFGLQAVYLFGSRAAAGIALLEGKTVERDGSDLDVGLVFNAPDFAPAILSRLQVAFEDLFDPLSVDLVPLQRVDPLLAFSAIDGHRIVVTERTANDHFELSVMRAAAELLPVQRRLERDLFGTSTT